MKPRAAIRDAINHPLVAIKPRTEKRRPKPLGKGVLLGAQATAKLALMGKMSRDEAVQAIVRTIGNCRQV